MILHTYGPISIVLYLHTSWEKRDIALLWVRQWFFSHTREEKKWYYTLVGPQVFFIYSHSWRKRMMLHTCQSTSRLRLLATNVDFYLQKKRKKWYCTFTCLQVAFIYWHRWRITMILHTWAPTSGVFNSCKRRKKNGITYLQAHKWFYHIC